jgi:xanthine dehydrogenase accessory factor
VGEDLINHAILRELTSAVADDTPVVLATVIDTRRSVPRHAGSKMLIYGDGRTVGSIGGGEMEGRVLEEARAVFGDGKPRLLSYTLTDPGRGDPGICGGEVSLYLEAYMPASTVFVIGCGHIGRAVVDLAHWIGFRVVAYDDRPEQADAEALPGADVVLGGAFAAALEEAPITSETHVVLVSRNMGIDLEVLPLVLATPARSIGVMGSRRRWLETRNALVEAGISTDALGRLHAPIGLELNAETPEEIALSIMSEIVMERRGGDGAAMSDAVR